MSASKIYRKFLRCTANTVARRRDVRGQLQMVLFVKCVCCCGRGASSVGRVRLSVGLRLFSLTHTRLSTMYDSVCSQGSGGWVSHWGCRAAVLSLATLVAIRRRHFRSGTTMLIARVCEDSLLKYPSWPVIE